MNDAGEIRVFERRFQWLMWIRNERGNKSMVGYLYKDLLEACAYLPASLLAGCAVLLAAGGLGRVVQKRFPRLPVFLWAVYLTQLGWLVLWNRPPGSRRSLDLTLFDTMSHSARGNSYVVENVLLFLPFGILWAVFGCGKTRRSWFRCLAAAGVCSLLIEVLQYITCRGFSQTDDVVMNVIGACLGYGLAWGSGDRRSSQQKSGRRI